MPVDAHPPGGQTRDCDPPRVTSKPGAGGGLTRRWMRDLAMFVFTQRRARSWSFIPMFPWQAVKDFYGSAHLDIGAREGEEAEGPEPVVDGDDDHPGLEEVVLAGVVHPCRTVVDEDLKPDFTNRPSRRLSPW